MPVKRAARRTSDLPWSYSAQIVLATGQQPARTQNCWSFFRPWVFVSRFARLAIGSPAVILSGNHGDGQVSS